nr:PREDICTED: RNA-binding protein 25-like [Lepisosteus oculatus]
MNWDSQLSAVLSAADGSVAKIRERLNTASHFSKDVYPDSGQFRSVCFEESPLSRPSAPLSGVPSAGKQWGQLPEILSRLQDQSQAIQSLTQAVRLLERERDKQQQHLQALQEEVRRLRDREQQRERGGSETEGRLDQWRREVRGELQSLTEKLERVAARQDSFSGKLQREEMEQLKRELDHLKHKLRRQEDDLLSQISETRDMRRQYERNTKMLESLADSYRGHAEDLTRTLSQQQSAHHDLHSLRSCVSELKDEMRGLRLADSQPMSSHGTRRAGDCVSGRQHQQSRESGGSDLLEEDSEGELSPSLSLGDVSSEDLSLLSETPAPPQPRTGTRPHHLLEGSDNGEAGSGLDEEEEVLSIEEDLGELSDSPPELNLSDL